MKPLRRAVMAIIVNEQNEVLIGYSPRDGGFKFPQGGLEENENPILGLIRELQEELAIKINSEDIVESFNETAVYLFPEHLTAIRPYRGQELFVFRINYNDSMQFEPQDDEFDSMFWKTPNEIDLMDLSFRRPAYIKALKMCKLL